MNNTLTLPPITETFSNSDLITLRIAWTRSTEAAGASGEGSEAEADTVLREAEGEVGKPGHATTATSTATWMPSAKIVAEPDCIPRVSWPVDQDFDDLQENKLGKSGKIT